MNEKQTQTRNRIFCALVLFIVAGIITKTLPLSAWFGGDDGALWAEFILFFVPYLIAGYDVLLKAIRNSIRGHLFDENFLMSIATIGAFALILFPDSKPHMAEGAAVMLFYQVGELFQSYAVGKSRASIAAMMDIAPEYATIERDGQQVQVAPHDVAVGNEIIVKPGERVPLDGVVIQGTSQLDTAALTGESMPREVLDGDEILSGCINLSGKLTIKVTKPYEDSTVSRILELVENAADKKARTENFITRFARYYTPFVVVAAALLSILPPLLLQTNWSDWIQRGLIFLVVSCPCALVISVPLSFFGGIGAASRAGILVKGGNYLEVLASVKTVVFDKTGTLTDGSFNVVDIHPEAGVDSERLLSIAAHAEAYSNHPIALSIKKAYSGPLDLARVSSIEEQSGCGICAVIDKHTIFIGNDKLMRKQGIDFHTCELAGTVLHVSLDNEYIGHIVIADIIKPHAKRAITNLHHAGVKKIVMLTGDRTDVAAAVAQELDIDEYRAQLLPQDKVAQVETLLEQAHAQEGAKNKLAFVGDGINDAPVLTRADIGIAMGALGSDAAIEAADIVLMDDKLFHIGFAIQIARKTMSIVRENIVFALGIKLLVLIFATLGLANMWIAVFADVGVAVLAILNAMRTLALHPPQNHSSQTS